MNFRIHTDIFNLIEMDLDVIFRDDIIRDLVVIVETKFCRILDRQGVQRTAVPLTALGGDEPVLTYDLTVQERILKVADLFDIEVQILAPESLKTVVLLKSEVRLQLIFRRGCKIDVHRLEDRLRDCVKLLVVDVLHQFVDGDRVAVLVREALVRTVLQLCRCKSRDQFHSLIRRDRQFQRTGLVGLQKRRTERIAARFLLLLLHQRPDLLGCRRIDADARHPRLLLRLTNGNKRERKIFRTEARILQHEEIANLLCSQAVGNQLKRIVRRNISARNIRERSAVLHAVLEYETGIQRHVAVDDIALTDKLLAGFIVAPAEEHRAESRRYRERIDRGSRGNDRFLGKHGVVLLVFTGIFREGKCHSAIPFRNR